jgi:hypothetical protein
VYDNSDRPAEPEEIGARMAQALFSGVPTDAVGDAMADALMATVVANRNEAAAAAAAAEAGNQREGRVSFDCNVSTEFESFQE